MADLPTGSFKPAADPGEIPENILDDAWEQYQKDSQGKGGFTAPSFLFQMQYRYGWDFVRFELIESGEVPPCEVIKERARHTILPRLPVTDEDIIGIFKKGMAACIKAAQEKAGQ